MYSSYASDPSTMVNSCQLAEKMFGKEGGGIYKEGNIRGLYI